MRPEKWTFAVEKVSVKYKTFFTIDRTEKTQRAWHKKSWISSAL